MMQIVISKKSGEYVRTIDVPEGMTVKELAQHLRESRGGVRPQPHDRVTIGDGAGDELPDTEPEPAGSCGS